MKKVLLCFVVSLSVMLMIPSLVFASEVSESKAFAQINLSVPTGFEESVLVKFVNEDNPDLVFHATLSSSNNYEVTLWLPLGTYSASEVIFEKSNSYKLNISGIVLSSEGMTALVSGQVTSINDTPEVVEDAVKVPVKEEVVVADTVKDTTENNDTGIPVVALYAMGAFALIAVVAVVILIKKSRESKKYKKMVERMYAGGLAVALFFSSFSFGVGVSGVETAYALDYQNDVIPPRLFGTSGVLELNTTMQGIFNETTYSSISMYSRTIYDSADKEMHWYLYLTDETKNNLLQSNSLLSINSIEGSVHLFVSKKTGYSSATSVYSAWYTVDQSAVVNYLASVGVPDSQDYAQYNMGDAYHLFDGLTGHDDFVAGWKYVIDTVLGTYTEVPKTADLTVNASGSGSVSNISGTYDVGTALSVTATPSTGYSFTGWYNGGSLVSTSNPYSFTMPTYAYDLTANFTPNQYTLSYDSNGGTPCTSKQVTYGTAVGTLPSPTRTGYTFAGWRDSSNNLVTSTNVYSTAGNMLLTAQWSTNAYDVQYLNTGVGGSSGTVSNAYGSTVTINAGTRDGYWFTGWNVVSANVSLADISAPTTTFTMPASKVILQATWKQITGISATLNSNFTNAYAANCNNGAYDVDSGIVVTNDMVDVVINFDDGTQVSTSAIGITDGNVKAVGANYIEITLNGTVYKCNVEVVGYSASLSAVMQSLGLAPTDYIGLAAKISEMKANLESANNELQMYATTIEEIRAVLATGGINVSDSADLADRLSKAVAGVQSAVDKIKENETQLKLIQESVNGILGIFGVNGSDDGSYVTILAQLASATTLIESMHNRVNELESFVQDINTLLGLGSGATLDEIYTAIEALQNRLADAEKKLNEYQNALDDIMSAITGGVTGGDLDAQLAIILGNITSIKTELSSMSGLLSTLIDMQDKLLGSNTVVSGPAIGSSGILDTTIEEIKNKLEAYTQNSDSMVQIIEQLRHSLGLGSDSTLTDIVEAVDELQKDLQSAKDEADKYREEVEHIKSMLGVSGGSDELYAELEKLLTKIEEADRTIAAIEDMLSNVLGNSNITISDLSSIKDSIEGLKNDLNAATSEIDSLKLQLEMKDMTIEELQNKILELQSENSTLKGQIGSLESEVSGLKSQNSVLVSENGTLKNQVADLTQNGGEAAESLKKQLDSANSTISSLRSELANVTSNLEASKNEATNWENKYNSSVSEVEGLKDKVSDLSSSLVDATGRNEGYVDKITGLESEIAGLDSSISYLQSELSAAKNDYEALEGAYDDLTAEKSKLDSFIDGLKLTISNLETKVEALSSDDLAGKYSSLLDSYNELKEKYLDLVNSSEEIESDIDTSLVGDEKYQSLVEKYTQISKELKLVYSKLEAVQNNKVGALSLKGASDVPDSGDLAFYTSSGYETEEDGVKVVYIDSWKTSTGLVLSSEGYLLSTDDTFVWTSVLNVLEQADIAGTKNNVEELSDVVFYSIEVESGDIVKYVINNFIYDSSLDSLK